MIIKSENLILKDKEENEGVSKKTGNEYVMYKLYFKANDGLLYQILCNKALYERGEKEKTYKLVVEIPTTGQYRLNDIELQK